MSTGTLFDSLFDVNRPALNAYVTQGQTMAGLRTAQTQEALNNAQAQVEKESAFNDLGNGLQGMGFKPSEAQSMVDYVRATGHDPAELFSAAQGRENELLTGIVADPNAPTPARTAALQALSKKGDVGQTQDVGNQLVNGINPNQPPVVTQTPLSQADINLKNAQAAHQTAQANTSATLDPDAVAFGAYRLYKTGQMPPMGMGNGPMRTAMLHGAAVLADNAANGQDVSNPGFDTAIANGQDFAGAQRTINSVAGGPLGNTTRALNNVVGHLSMYDQLAQQLGNGSFRPGNALDVAWQKMFNSPAPANMQAAAALIGPELTKMMQGSGAGTETERETFAQTAGNLTNSPEATSSAIGTLRQMLGRQAADLAFQYHGATKRGDFATRYLQPDVAEYLGINPETGAQTGPPGHSGAGAPPAAAATAPANLQALAQTELARRGIHLQAPGAQ
jgi:hypothetical protein